MGRVFDPMAQLGRPKWAGPWAMYRSNYSILFGLYFIRVSSLVSCDKHTTSRGALRTDLPGALPGASCEVTQQNPSPCKAQHSNGTIASRYLRITTDRYHRPPTTQRTTGKLFTTDLTTHRDQLAPRNTGLPMKHVILKEILYGLQEAQY
jgi:hypothetical protein